MRKNTSILAAEGDLLVDLTFHDFSASLLTEFAEKIVRPYYSGNMSSALKDLVQKAIKDEDFVAACTKV